MKLSAIAAKSVAAGGKDLGFTVKSTVTGNVLQVIARTPGGSFLVVKKSGKNAGKESLVEDNDRYELVNPASSRIDAIKAELKTLGMQAEEIDTKMGVLEDELAELEDVG